ncbi:hypothetical protein AB6C91_13640 [Vibrio cyclitrophicus]
MRVLWLYIKNYLELKRVPENVRVWVITFLALVFSFAVLLLILLFSKLGENTSYTLKVNSEFFQYTPNDKNSSDILLKNFSVGECGDVQFIKEQARTLEGVLNLNQGAEVSITRFSDRNLIIEILGKDAKYSSGALSVDFNKEFLPICTAIVVELDTNNPIFSANLIGDVQIGKNISDASDYYFPTLKEGYVEISDYSLITESNYYFSPRVFNNGDYVYFKKEKNNPVKGYIRAEYNDKGLNGVFFSNGGKVFIQKYRSLPQKVDVSFINRITEDNEATLAFTVLFVFIQLVAFIISFLLRIKIINISREDLND